MRALSHCDFCGADAAGTFELLPPELEPTEDEQRRVVLCQACSARLEELLEPLLARAGVESADETTAGDTDGPADSNRLDSADDSTTGDASELETADEDAPSDSTESSRPAVIDVNAAKTGPDENEADTDAGSDASNTDADPDRPDSSEPTAATDRGITLERTADEDSSAEASTENPSDEHDADSSTDADRDADGVDDGGSATAADSSTSPPRGYGKVIRLLRNREFPMARSDVETLAAGAYDLDPHTVEEIVEYALEDGEFAEDGGQLVRR
ncbi:hypothetical protein EL22_06020 [Halostagnicola sp. A56]|uniref:hypothetical protein n=1 Tax=Halostagnicola sp. A56 TaxID=1495067 RepID=UPI0004A0E36A|nr:hypothetical protein [Halostagnicola sp. A56]KDE58278.1 hypothetical protein EL22_06020 [Halostagnicola sp. A56]